MVKRRTQHLHHAWDIIRLSVSSHSSTRLKFSALALVSGALSGLVTTAAARYLDPANPLLGAIFGVLLTLLIWRQQKSFSVLLPVFLIPSSIAAYVVSIYGSLYVAELLTTFFGAKGRITDPFSALTFLLAGFIGALMINVAVLLLLRAVKGFRLLAIAAVWACLGGVLALCAFELSGPLGSAVATIVGAPPSMHMGNNDLFYHAFDSGYFLWQAGMAVVIFLMLPQRAASASEQPAAGLRSPVNFSIFGNLFFVGIFALLFYLAYSAGGSAYQRWRFERQTNQLVRETPSVQNLPVVALKPLEQMLILHDIAGYSVIKATAQDAPQHKVYVGVKGMPQYLAQRILYSVLYQKAAPGQTSVEPSQATVIVSEFPNAAWAQFGVKNGPPNDGGPYLYMTSTRQMKFGNSVLVHKAKEPDLCAFWPSSTNVVVVWYPGEQAEEILKLYLEKYPSSL